MNDCTCDIPGVVFDGKCPQHGLGTPPPASLTGVMQAPVATNLDPDTEGI